MTRRVPFFPFALLLALGAFAMHAPSHAQRGAFKGEKAENAEKGGQGEAGGGIRPSGLRPAFAAQARCAEIASPYGSQTRYDGSYRPKWAFGGFHGGIDLSLAEGTPLLAVAKGTVAAKGEGGMLEGIYIWLRHAPEDTGLGYWVYSKYQHLQAMPELDVGAAVTLGQVIGRSGGTGTVGRHYGAAGYPHLHLTTVKSARGDETVGSRDAARGLLLFDPLAIYHEAGGKPPLGAGASGQETAVPIPYATVDGKVFPPDTRVVWPVPCQPR